MSLSRAREKLLGRLRHRKSREREGLFLVEGIRSASEALETGTRISFAVTSPRVRELAGGEELALALRDAGVEVHEVEDAELARLSDTQTPQGVLLACREPSAGLAELVPTDVAGRRGRALRLLVLDGIQDPGNLGTLVRAAAAFALSGVLLLEGTVDPYNPKAVRAAAGGLFRVPVVRVPWSEVGGWLEERGVRLLVAEAHGTDVARARAAPPWALVVGSEAAGARGEIVSAAARVVAVPMPGGSDSLNAGVAGAVLLYALTREDAGA